MAGADPLQQQAAQGASQLGGDRSWLDSIMSQNGPSVQNASLLDGLDKYMSPYTQQVVDASLADFDYGAGQTRAQQDLDMARSGAFGGSGAAITRSMTEDALNRGRAMTSATLRDQGFQVGAGLSGQDADRRQQASALNAQLAQQQAALRGQLGFAAEESDRANVGLQGDLGAMLRAIAQDKAVSPINLLQTQVALQGGLPLGLFQGQNQSGTSRASQTTTSSDPMGTLGSLAMLAAAPFTGGASLGGLAGLGGMFGANAIRGAVPLTQSLSNGVMTVQPRL